MKKTAIFLGLVFMVLLLFVGFGCVDSSNTGEKESQKEEAVYYDSIEKYFDEETGVMVYYDAPSINAVQIANPAVPLKDLPENKKLIHDETRSYIKRWIDKENNVVVYYGCSGYNWMSCDMVTVRIVNMETGK